MRTGHSAQMRLASLDDPPFSGKKTSGSYSRHRARSCHGMKWCTPLPQNYIVVILDPSTAGWQVGTENFFDISHRFFLRMTMLTKGEATRKESRAFFFSSRALLSIGKAT